MAKKKVVLGLPMEDAKKRTKALECAAKFSGVVSMSIGENQLTVEGEEIDPVVMVLRLRKKVGCTKLQTVDTVGKKEKVTVKKNGGETKVVAEKPTTSPAMVPYYVQPPLPVYYMYEDGDQSQENCCSIQ